MELLDAGTSIELCMPFSWLSPGMVRVLPWLPMWWFAFLEAMRWSESCPRDLVGERGEEYASSSSAKAEGGGAMVNRGLY